MNDAFDDLDLSPEDEALLNKDTPLPESDDGTGDAPNPDPAAATDEHNDDGQADEGSDKDGAEAEAGGRDHDPDRDLAAFMERHKDKSPEELMRIAFQQDQARRQERHERRATSDTLNQLLERIQSSRQQREQEIQQRRQQFDDELSADPDAATRRLHDELLTREQREAEQREWNAYLAEQSRLTREAIPDFDHVQQDMMQTAVEVLGYAPEEVARVADHRDVVTLEMATRFHRLVQQGVIDRRGNYVGGQAPAGQAPRQAPTPQHQASHQRLDTIAQKQGQQTRSLSSTRGAPGGRGNSLQQRAQELLSMSDDEFMSVPDKDLDVILKQLHGG